MALVEVKQKRGAPALFAVVDDDLATLARQYSWRTSGNPNDETRPRTNVRRPNGTPTVLFLHHLVLPPVRGLFVDHINRNQLDNRRENLRYLTPSESRQNNSGWAHHSTAHRNVCRIGPHARHHAGAYRVQVPDGKGRVRSAYRRTEAEAIAIARQWRLELMPFSYEATA